MDLAEKCKRSNLVGLLGPESKSKSKKTTAPPNSVGAIVSEPTELGVESEAAREMEGLPEGKMAVDTMELKFDPLDSTVDPFPFGASFSNTKKHIPVARWLAGRCWGTKPNCNGMK